MNKWALVLVFGFLVINVNSQVSMFNNYPVYTGTDLGAVYSKSKTTFRIWAPAAQEATLVFYNEGEGGKAIKEVSMTKMEDGTWYALEQGDIKGRYYAFKVKIDGVWSAEVPDPYAKAVGVNGKRAVIIDLKETDPTGWKTDKSPAFKSKTDAIIYELHVRDASIAGNSCISNKGKFLGLTEKGTKSEHGLATGLDHLVEMGVTHIHLLPFFDYNSVDESKPGKPQYNWGYDPLNYNTTEGSYSTNPYDGITRIKEFKQLVKSFHDRGLRVVMDVVYNHTALTENSYFNQLVPGYYYRQTKDGKFSNATACGNETASERPMVRKFILESMKYWVEEFHIDGFRVDLMGVHDIKTMNEVSKELHRIKPDILLYGEGWTAGSSPLPDSMRAIKKNVSKLDRIAVFSDDMRDGIKGSVFDHEDKGFASGKKNMEESIKFGLVASTKHPQVDYSKVNYSKSPYSKEPWQTINYAECHDNHILWDKLAISAKDMSEEQRREMHKLALSIVLTSQGISFLHAGTEFLRTKHGVENSFNSPDSINEIDWSLKSKNKDVLEYTKGLISMRKAHPAFRMKSTQEITKHLKFDKGIKFTPGMVSFTINGAAVGDQWKEILVIYWGQPKSKKLVLPEGAWIFHILNNKVDGGKAGTEIELAPFSCNVLFKS